VALRDLLDGDDHVGQSNIPRLCLQHRNQPIGLQYHIAKIDSLDYIPSFDMNVCTSPDQALRSQTRLMHI